MRGRIGIYSRVSDVSREAQSKDTSEFSRKRRRRENIGGRSNQPPQASGMGRKRGKAKFEFYCDTTNNTVEADGQASPPFLSLKFIHTFREWIKLNWKKKKCKNQNFRRFNLKNIEHRLQQWQSFLESPKQFDSGNYCIIMIHRRRTMR